MIKNSIMRLQDVTVTYEQNDAPAGGGAAAGAATKLSLTHKSFIINLLGGRANSIDACDSSSM